MAITESSKVRLCSKPPDYFTTVITFVILFFIGVIITQMIIDYNNNYPDITYNIYKPTKNFNCSRLKSVTPL